MKEEINQYRELLENISLARQINESLAQRLISEFCDRLENQLFLLHEIKQDRDISKAVHNKLEIISDSLTRRAQKFYEGIPNSLEFKSLLVSCHEETNLAYTTNQVSRACRNAFRQIETLVSYIITKANLIKWLTDNRADWKKYPNERIAAIKADASSTEAHRIISASLSLFNKLWLINHYFPAFFKTHREGKGSLMGSFEQPKYHSCYRLRHADSHGWNFSSSITDQETLLKQVEADFESHLRELTKVVVLLRDLVQSLREEYFYVSISI